MDPTFSVPDPEDLLPEDEEQGMFEHFRLNVDPGQAPLRIDKYMAAHLEDTSRHRIQCAIKEGYVRIGDIPVKANRIVRPGDVIRFVMPYRRRGLEIIPQDIPLDILYEDDDLLVLNKPAGMVVHPGHGHYEGTLVNALAFHLGLSQGPDAADERMGILVHRIDKDTSGLLVVAKNDEAQLNLARQFFEHSIQRRYVAVVWGNLPDDEGTVDAAIGRDPADRLRFRVCEEDKGKHAVTHYKVLERFGYVTVVECAALRRRTLWRNHDPQGHRLRQIPPVHPELLRSVPAPGPARQDPRFRASRHRPLDTIRLHGPGGHGVDDCQMAVVCKFLITCRRAFRPSGRDRPSDRPSCRSCSRRRFRNGRSAPRSHTGPACC